MSSIWVRIDGLPATEIAAHTPPTWETLADGGCGSASLAFALHGRAQHQVLKAGALVEILCGPVPLWRGLMTEPDRTTWECHAAGLSASLRTYLAVDALGANTRNLTTAIGEAILRGWRGSNPAPVSGPVAGDPAGNPVKVGDLLDDYAEQTGQRWGVDGYGALFMRPDPGSPRWLTVPDVAAFGPTSEGTAGRLAGRFFDGSNNDTAFAGTSAPEESVDLTDRGALTKSAAEAILAGMLVRSGETSWTNSVTLHREQLTTLGGQTAFLPGVRAGHKVRAHGLAYGVVTHAPWLDVVIGKTTYTAGEDSITLEPVNSAPRTLTGVLAAA